MAGRRCQLSICLKRIICHCSGIINQCSYNARKSCSFAVFHKDESCGTCYGINQNGEISILPAGTTPGVYIQSPEDKQILTHIYTINGILKSSYITLYQSFRSFSDGTNWWYLIPFVYSSNNQIPFSGGCTRSAIMRWFV